MKSQDRLIDRGFSALFSGRSIMRLRALPLLLSVFLFPLILSGCGSSQSGGAGNVDSDSLVYRVVCGQVRRAMVENLEGYTANVRAFEENHISAGVAGRIQRLRVDVGDKVHRGQVLVEMDPTQLLQQRAQLATLEKDYKRIDTLYKVGSISRQQYDQIKTQYEVTKAAVDNLARNTILTSPINGVVTGRYYNEGELYTMAPTPASAGRSAIISVMQVNPVKVVFNAPEEFYARIKPKQPVRIRLDAYGDREFIGNVYRIAPNIDPISHTFFVEVSVQNDDGALRPGMFARAYVDFGKIERVLVPDLAVQQQRGSAERYLYVVANGMVRRVTVQVGARHDDAIEVLSGLEGDEQVVLSGFRQLKDGARVECVNPNDL